MVLALAPAAQAGFTGQLGILDEAWFTANPTNPGTSAPWQDGDTYHFAFVTDAGMAQGSGWPTATPFPHLIDNISAFNDFVQAEADAAGEPRVLGVTWKVIGSTASVDAKVNALVSGPVYTTAGNILGTGYADMWDGAVANVMAYMDGSPAPVLAWTGSNPDGTASSIPLGPTGPRCGIGNAGYSDVPGNYPWLLRHEHPSQDIWRAYQLYGLSEGLEVTATGGGGGVIPEPMTMCALGLAVAGLGGYVRRRRKA